MSAPPADAAALGPALCPRWALACFPARGGVGEGWSCCCWRPETAFPPCRSPSDPCSLPSPPSLRRSVFPSVPHSLPLSVPPSLPPSLPSNVRPPRVPRGLALISPCLPAFPPPGAVSIPGSCGIWGVHVAARCSMVTAGRLQGHGWASDGGAEAQRRRAAGGRAGPDAARAGCFGSWRSPASRPVQNRVVVLAVVVGVGVGGVCLGVWVCGCVGVSGGVWGCACPRAGARALRWRVGWGIKRARVVEKHERSAGAAPRA